MERGGGGEMLGYKRYSSFFLPTPTSNPPPPPLLWRKKTVGRRKGQSITAFSLFSLPISGERRRVVATTGCWMENQGWVQRKKRKKEQNMSA